MRCLKPCFLSSHGIRGRSETRFDNSVSRPDPHVVTVGPVGRLGPRLCRWMSHPARCTRVFPSRRPYAACLHITPFPAVACFPLPKACACRARYLLGLPPSGFSFQRAFAAPCSPSPFVVKRLYTNVEHCVNKNLQKHKYEIKQYPPTP